MTPNVGKLIFMMAITVGFNSPILANTVSPAICQNAYHANENILPYRTRRPAVYLGSDASVTTVTPFPADPMIRVFRANGFPYDGDHSWNASLGIREPVVEADGKIVLTVLNFFVEKPHGAPDPSPDGEGYIDARHVATALMEEAMTHIGNVDRIRMNPTGDDDYIIRDALKWRTPVEMAVRRTLLVESLDRAMPGVWAIAELPTLGRSAFTLERVP